VRRARIAAKATKPLCSALSAPPRLIGALGRQTVATLHQTTGRRSLGLGLAMITAASWGWLSIGLKIILDQLDGWTIAWARFAGSALVLWAFHGVAGRLPAKAFLTLGALKLVLVASVGLAGNYLGWISGLRYVSPATAGLVIQLSPLFLALAAALIFRERIGRMQAAGFVLLLAGLVVYFRDQVGLLVTDPHLYGLGVLMIGLSGASWVLYGLAQKQLLRDFASPQTVMMIYTGAALLLLPGAKIGAVGELDPLRLSMLALVTLNTLIAYGCLSEGLRHAEASRIGAVLPLQSLFTFVFMHFMTLFWPGLVAPEQLSPTTLAGAAAVTIGAAMAALAKG